MSDVNFLASMSPEQRMRYAQGGALADESTALDDQIAQARALRGQNLASQHTSPAGAALGGIADLLNAGRSAQMEHQAQERQQGIRGQQTAIRGDTLGAYGQAMGDSQAQQQMEMQAIIKALRGHGQQQPSPDFNGTVSPYLTNSGM